MTKQFVIGALLYLAVIPYGLEAISLDDTFRWEYVEDAVEERKLVFRTEIGFDENDIARLLKFTLTNISDEQQLLAVPPQERIINFVTIRQMSEVFALTTSSDLEGFNEWADVNNLASGESIVWEIKAPEVISDISHYELTADYNELRIILFLRLVLLKESDVLENFQGETMLRVLRWTNREATRLPVQ